MSSPFSLAVTGLFSLATFFSETLLRPPFEQLQVGDILVLDAGQPVPVDAVVVVGSATVDQHRLTGESQPVEKTVGDAVLAATLVVGGRILARVEKTGAQTAAARIGEILERTIVSQEARIADQFAKVEHTLVPTLSAGLLGFVLRGPMTGLAMVGCNYLVSTLPLQLLFLLNGLSAGAKRGILIKDGRAFDKIGIVDTIVFDKTGTLTLERPQVIQIHACPNEDADNVLRLAAAAERRQTHPIAHAILDAAAASGLDVPLVDETHYKIGSGLIVSLGGRRVRVGSQRFMEMEGITLPQGMQLALQAAQAKGNSLVFVAMDGEVVGAIELTTTLRPETQKVVDWLRSQGFALYILSGDQESATRKLATQLGMDGYFANTLPEQKALRIKELQNDGHRVCFVGDGINDAVALLQADVSVSFRGATTVATDAAQIVLMDGQLEQLHTLFVLANAHDLNVKGAFRRAKGFSFAAGATVLLMPKYQYYFVPLGYIVLLGIGLANTQRPLLGGGKDCEEMPDREI